MSTITEAAAHIKQLMDLGCDYEEAVSNTQVAFELDQESMDLVESVFSVDEWEAAEAVHEMIYG